MSQFFHDNTNNSDSSEGEEEHTLILLRGINLSDGKSPPSHPSYLPSSLSPQLAPSISYIDAPFPLSDAAHHLRKIRTSGFNTLRLAVVWEALEHSGPGQYDEEFLTYIHSLVSLCCSPDLNFKVIINPHQDLFSRFSGGSGAPLWTLHACGLDPDGFPTTQAAIRYADWPLEERDPDKKEPKDIPDMMWTTNHNRLATNTLFCLFFSGKKYAPKCLVNGVNIQDFLQGHYFAAYAKLAEKLRDLPVFGWDSMNEPEAGYAGLKDLGRCEREDTAKIGSNPTPIQCMRLGMGMEEGKVDDFKLGSTGPHKVGTVRITPERGCWLENKSEWDEKWGFKRGEEWEKGMGTCVWALHGVWDVESGELLRKDYFAEMGGGGDGGEEAGEGGEEEKTFTTTYWREFHEKWTETILSSSSSQQTPYIFLQPPVFTPPPPPSRLNSSSSSTPSKIAYAPHYYDGLTIMKSHWHSHWNADVLGLLRGHYKTKIQGLRLGRSNVRKVFTDQMAQLSRDFTEGPTMIGEMGIPFPLDKGKAFRDGDYTQQVEALDTLMGASAEDNLLGGVVLWTYSMRNTHEWGDGGWNGEDLSVYSRETGSFVGGGVRNEMWEGFRGAAGWCRPFVERWSGGGGGYLLKGMGFEISKGKFWAEVEAAVEGGGSGEKKEEEEGGGGDGKRKKNRGWATVYVPWLHYREKDDGEGLALDVKVSGGGDDDDDEDDEGTWEIKGPQELRWEFGGKSARLEIERKGGPLSPEQLGTIVKLPSPPSSSRKGEEEVEVNGK